MRCLERSHVEQRVGAFQQLPGPHPSFLPEIPMDEKQLRMACLEQAIRLYKYTDDITPKDIVVGATLLFDFVKAGTMPPKDEVTE